MIKGRRRKEKRSKKKIDKEERGKKEIDFSIMCLGFGLLFSPFFLDVSLFSRREVAVLCLPLDFVLWSSLSATKERSTLRATKRVVKRRKRDHHHRCLSARSERDHHHYLFLLLSSSPLVLPLEDKAKKSGLLLLRLHRL